MKIIGDEIRIKILPILFALMMVGSGLALAQSDSTTDEGESYGHSDGNNDPAHSGVPDNEDRWEGVHVSGVVVDLDGEPLPHVDIYAMQIIDENEDESAGRQSTDPDSDESHNSDEREDAPYSNHHRDWAWTNEDGEFTLSLEEGEYQVELYRYDYYRDVLVLVVSDEMSELVWEMEPLPEERWDVSVEMLDENGNQFEWGWAHASTEHVASNGNLLVIDQYPVWDDRDASADGTLFLGNSFSLWDGEWTISLNPSNRSYLPLILEVTVNGGDLSLTTSFEPWVANISIVGQVLDEDGEAVSDAIVMADRDAGGWATHAVTNDSGWYQMDVIPDMLNLCAVAFGHNRGDEVIQLDTTGIMLPEINIELEKNTETSTIEGEVFDTDGEESAATITVTTYLTGGWFEPMIAMEMDHSDNGAYITTEPNAVSMGSMMGQSRELEVTVATFETDSDGTFTFELPTDEFVYVVAENDEGAKSQPHWVHTSWSDTLHLILFEPEDVLVTGQLTDEDGNALPGVTIQFQRDGYHIWDDDGYYEDDERGEGNGDGGEQPPGDPDYPEDDSSDEEGESGDDMGHQATDEDREDEPGQDHTMNDIWFGHPWNWMYNWTTTDENGFYSISIYSAEYLVTARTCLGGPNHGGHPNDSTTSGEEYYHPERSADSAMLGEYRECIIIKTEIEQDFTAGEHLLDLVLEPVRHDHTIIGSYQLMRGTLTDDPMCEVSFNGQDYYNSTMISADGTFEMNVPSDAFLRGWVFCENRLVRVLEPQMRVETGGIGQLTEVAIPMSVFSLDATIHGTLIDEDGETVEGVHISAWGPWYSSDTTSDENGEFTLELVGGFMYGLNAIEYTDESYKGAWRKVYLLSGDEISLTLTLKESDYTYRDDTDCAMGISEEMENDRANYGAPMSGGGDNEGMMYDVAHNDRRKDSDGATTNSRMSEEMPWRVLLNPLVPMPGQPVEIQVLDLENNPVVGAEVKLVEYLGDSRRVLSDGRTDGEGKLILEFPNFIDDGLPEDAHWEFIVNALDEDGAETTLATTTISREMASEAAKGVMPSIGLIATVALLGVVALLRRNDD